VYGSIYVVDAALAAGDAAHGVQTSGWSNGKVSTWAHLYQHGGDPAFPGTDYNDIRRSPHGMWLQTQGDDMPTAEEIAQAVWGYHVNSQDGKQTHSTAYWVENPNEQLAGLKGQLSALAVAVGKITPGQVDVPALASALAADLGPDLGHELVAALTAALSN